MPSPTKIRPASPDTLLMRHGGKASSRKCLRPPCESQASIPVRPRRPMESRISRALLHLDRAEAYLNVGKLRRGRLALGAVIRLLGDDPTLPPALVLRLVLACAMLRAEPGVLAWGAGVLATRALRGFLHDLRTDGAGHAIAPGARAPTASGRDAMKYPMREAPRSSDAL